MTRIELEGGKYTVIHDNGLDFHALRYGERWRDLTGDGLVLAMAQEIEDLHDALLQATQERNAASRNASAFEDMAGRLQIANGKLQAHKSRLAERCSALEKLRPIWAKGYSDESVAAQVASGALVELWTMLGVTDQTAAVLALKGLPEKNDG